MYFNNKTFFPWTEGKNIDVIGFGVSNAELVFRLAAAGASVTLHDRRKAEQFRPEQLDRLREAGVIWRSGKITWNTSTERSSSVLPGFPT